MANRNWMNGGKVFAMHASPVQIDLQFQVDSTQGAGISNLKGPTVAAVYMHAATPSASSPAPIAGTIVVQLQDNYNKLLDFNAAIMSPTSGSDVKIDNSAMTAGTAYVITTLGNATAAKWKAIGVPAGVTPAVGVSFIAASDGGSGNTLTSRVQTAAAAGSGVASIEIVGVPNQSVAPVGTPGAGAQIIMIARDYAGSIVAPAAGSIISLRLLMSNSSVQVQGE